jgi:hypothetical protein
MPSRWWNTGCGHPVETFSGVIERPMVALHGGHVACPCLSLLLSGRLHAAHACILDTPSTDAAWKGHANTAWGATAPRVQPTYHPIGT